VVLDLGDLFRPEILPYESLRQRSRTGLLRNQTGRVEKRKGMTKLMTPFRRLMSNIKIANANGAKEIASPMRPLLR
jgi:hypothetical protein